MIANKALAFAIFGISMTFNQSVRADLMDMFALGDTLDSIKSRYPSLIIEPLTPGWAKPYEKIYLIKGSGLGGSISLRLLDPIEFCEMIDRLSKQQGITAAEREAQAFIKGARLTCPLRAWGNERTPYVDATSFARLVFDNPVPLKTIAKKYGKWSKEYVSNSYKTTYEWKHIGIAATELDQGGFVESIEYTFTARAIYKYCSMHVDKVLKNDPHLEKGLKKGLTHACAGDFEAMEAELKSREKQGKTSRDSTEARQRSK